ncbi:restriction endonuclease subunit S [Mesorhizobium huakuii]|uniref:Restriction endonuclease subunit S n=1 Tax=Mesorhizobium huakuii TaxID=28104 RepID=A0ABZ0VTK5_9HYPH|nr:restriction endonuclease subunit S [Mesorhizobium huakuii]WQB99745.1 restriction endonuclease subunit S [Mesorhizobium huakuii]
MSLPMKDSGVEWLGEVPAHWSVARLATAVREVARAGHQDLPVLSISIHDGISDDELDETERNRKVAHIEDRSKYKRVVPGDIAYNMMRAWQGAFGAVAVEGQVSPAYVVAAPIRPINSNYVELLLRTPMAIEEMRRFSRGIADFRSRLYWEHFRNIRVCFPPIEEQDRIVSRIAKVTSRIDVLVVKKVRFIELLREKRQALITHAVTKGLDPNVPMSDSGVEWLGKIPAHWIVGRLRDFTQSISTGPFGTALSSSDYIEGGVPVINPSHITEFGCLPDQDVTVSEETAIRLAFWRMAPDDVVTARRGELGRSAVITEQEAGWICGTGSLRVRPNTTKATSEYIHALMHSVATRSWLDYQSVGSTMPNLNEALLGSLPVAVPPSLREQRKLVSMLDAARQKVDILIAKTERSIDLLREHRTALITAAVTGKIDLRNAA